LLAQEKIGQDVVYRKGGSVLRGTIIEETDEYVKIATQHGVAQISKSDIVRIDHAPTVEEEYRKRLKQTPDDDAQKQYELAQWCKKFGLEGRARYHLFKALTADPDHAPTRIALGYVRYGGAWLPKKQVAKMIEGTNLVIYQGQVMTKQEYEKLKPAEPQPLERQKPPDQKPASKQQPKEEGVAWEKARISKVGEYALKTNLPRRKAVLYRNTVSSIQSNLKTMLGSIIKKKDAKRTNIWIFRNGEEFSMRTGVRKEDGGFWRRDERLIATYDGAPEEKGGTRRILARMMAYDWMARCTARGAVVPTWLTEGVAGYFEAARFDESGRCKLGGLPRQAVVTLKGLLQNGRLVRISDLLRTPRARFNDTYKIAAWSLVHFLNRSYKYRRALARYWHAVKVVSSARRQRPPFPLRSHNAIKIFTKHFGSVEDIETAWRAWIAKLPVPDEGKIRGDTYTSNKYGFSFTKPSDFSFLRQSTTAGFQIGAQKDDARIEVLVLTNNRGYDAAGLVTAEKKRLSRIYSKVESAEVTCADASGFLLTYDDNQRRRPLPQGQPVHFCLTAYFVKSGKIYVVSCVCFSVNRTRYEAVFRKTVSAFKVGGE
ncbi:MAG: hypothetical protein DRP63_01105, partial [Planctomycetota bacterium]